jgi:hypothetical protein
VAGELLHQLSLSVADISWGESFALPLVQGAVSTVLVVVTSEVEATHVPAAKAGALLTLEPLVER